MKTPTLRQARLRRYCEQLTIEQLHRLDRTIYDRIYRAFSGGIVYGVDWSTLWTCHPGLATALDVARSVQAERCA